MSEKVVIDVVARALADAEFRELLFADSAAALSGYELTETERDLLHDLREDAFDTLAAEIEERISRVTPLPIPEPVPHSWKEKIIRAELTLLDVHWLLGTFAG